MSTNRAEASNGGRARKSPSARQMLRDLALADDEESLTCPSDFSSSEPESSEDGDEHLVMRLDSSTSQAAIPAHKSKKAEHISTRTQDDLEAPTQSNVPSDSSSDDLGRAVLLLASEVEALVSTPEMHRVLSRSQNVALQIVGSAWHVACLPVTVPINVVQSTTSVVVGICVHAAQQSIGWVDDHVLQNNAGEDSFQGQVDGLVHHVLSNVVPVALQTAGIVKDHVGSAVLGLLFGGDDHQAGAEASAEQSSFLDRLRLDYQVDVIQEEDEDDMSEDSWRPSNTFDANTAGTALSSSSLSPRRHGPRPPSTRRKFLLCVADLGLVDCAVPYINLKDESGIVSQAVDVLVRDGVRLCISHAETRPATAAAAHASEKIDWRGEACTDKYTRKKAQKKLSEQEWLSLLEREVLIWSGKAEDSNVPYFLSRGIVPGSPAAFRDLLWDNTRTPEYNKFCLGRSTQLVLGDEAITKVVQSETKVPFTGMTVQLSTLMHTVQLEDGSYVIACRSLKPKGEAKNEILWGVNLIRPVPNEPHKSDLVNLSQVRSALVPNFLTNRVGVMGVEQTYGGFRSLDYLSAPPSSCTANEAEA